jgi:hypothetical protein
MNEHYRHNKMGTNCQATEGELERTIEELQEKL